MRRLFCASLLGLLLCTQWGCGKRNVAVTPKYEIKSGPGVRRALAKAYITRGQYSEALQQLRQAQLAEGEAVEAETLTLLGVCLRELKLLPEAAEVLQKALAKSPSDAATWNALGIVHQGLREPEKALSAMKKACEISPDNADYQNNYGFSLFLSKKYAEAAVVLRKAVSLSGGDPRYRNNLGFALGAQGEDKAAKEEFLAAGGVALAENNMGVVLERRGLLVEAAERYAAALRLEPELTEARDNLSRIEALVTKPKESTVP